MFVPALLPKESPLPKESWRIIDTVLGFLLGVGLSAIIQFFYGSSQSSQNKSDQLNKLTDRLYTNPDQSASQGGR